MPGRPFGPPAPTASGTTTCARGSGSCPSTPGSSGRWRARPPSPRWSAPASRTADPERSPASSTGCSTTTGSGAWSTRDDRVAATAARARLRAAGPRLRDGVARLDSAGIAHTIQHDDLHGGNIVVGPAGDRFFDWGDAVIAHPFATLNVTFNSIAHRTARDLGDPAFDRLRDAYLEAWADVAPREVLLDAVGLARDLGCIGRALAWERALLDLAPDEMDGHGDAIAGWLVEFGERLDGPAWRS